MLRATEKTLNVLLDDVNKHRAKAGLCPLFFIKETRNLKLQKRHIYQLYVFPKDGVTELKALKSTQSTNSLRLYLAGILDGAEIGMKIARKEYELQKSWEGHK